MYVNLAFFVYFNQIKNIFCKLLTKCFSFGIIFEAQKRAPRYVENENPFCVQVAQKENRKFYMIKPCIQSLVNVAKTLAIYSKTMYHN